ACREAGARREVRQGSLAEDRGGRGPRLSVEPVGDDGSRGAPAHGPAEPRVLSTRAARSEESGRRRGTLPEAARRARWRARGTRVRARLRVQRGRPERRQRIDLGAPRPARSLGGPQRGRVARPLHGPARAGARAATLIRFLACLLVGLAACTPPVRVGSTGDYPPFSERVAGSWRGFDVEVARAWSHDRGRRLELVPVRWPDVDDAIRHHQVDVVMSGVTVRGDRLLEGRCTAAVARDEAVLVARRGVNAPARIAVNRGGHLERLARARLPGAQLELVDDNRRLRGILDSGTVDGIVTDALELRAIVPDPAAAGLVVIATLSDDRKAYFLPADAGPLATDLDAWLAAREHAGSLPALRARWLGDGTPEPRPSAGAALP